MKRRFVYILAGAALVGVLGLVGVNFTQASRPPAKLSFPVDGTLPAAPNSNAYEVYREIGDRLKVPTGLTHRKPRDWKDYPRIYEVLAANAAELARVDEAQGDSYSYREPVSLAVVPLFPHQTKFKLLARLLIVRGDLAIEKGDVRTAAADYLRVVRLGWQISNGAYDVAFTAGDNLIFLGLKALMGIGGNLAVSDREAIGRQLEAMGSELAPMSQPIKWEKIQAQMAWNEVLSKPSWTKALNADLGVDQLFESDPNQPDRVEELKGKLGLEADRRSRFERFFAENTRPETLYDNSTAYYDAWIDRVTGKFSDRSTTLPSLVAPGHLPDVYTGWIQEMELRYTLSDQRWLSRLRTVTSLKLLAIALRGDAALTNRSLMSDPFDPDREFRTLHRAGRILFYSVGPDGKDDRGTPLNDLMDVRKIEDLERLKGDLSLEYEASEISR